MHTNIENIDLRKFLPHRFPMLMVDKMLILNESLIETRFVIPENCIFLNREILTEAGLIENMAQTCSIVLGSSYFFDDDGVEENNSDIIGFISTIKTLQIYNLPEVNEILISKGEIISRIDGIDYSICEMKGNVLNKGEIILDCTLNLFIKRNNHESK